MDNLLNGQNPHELNQFERELNELKSITENYQKLLETLKASEAKYRFLTENSADIVWHLDKDLRFTYVSPADEKIRGYKQEEVIGKTIWEVITPEGALLVSEKMADRKMNNLPKHEPVRYELPLICKDGSILWSEVNVNPIFDVKGIIVGYNGITRDITERKKFEEAIKIKNEKLKELNENKDKFFSIIAHDLRSPFQGLLGISNLLVTEADNLTKEELKEFAVMLNNSLNNQYRLLEDLLNWARIQAGKMKFTPATINVYENIISALQKYKSNLENKNISITINVNENHEIFADRDMFLLVVRNLISNAIKFTNSGGAVIIKSLSDKTGTTLSVADNGVGIEEEFLEKLFKLDSHYSTEGTERETGSGLGLVLCKDIIDKHNGQIWVSSTHGKGSVFTFKLPFQKS